MPARSKKNLLIISCSATKKRKRGLIKAWDLYDGGIYRVLKKNKINFNKFDIKIVSAKYGLISRSTKIKYYNQKMTKRRAFQLLPIIFPQIANLLNRDYKNIYVCLGKEYLLATGLCVLESNRIEILKGSQGIQKQKIKNLIQRQNG